MGVIPNFSNGQNHTIMYSDTLTIYIPKFIWPTSGTVYTNSPELKGFAAMSIECRGRSV